jgi:hypothetical protein
MTFDQIMGIIAGINPFFIFKIFILIGFLFYIIFSLVVMRQVQLMLGVLEGSSHGGLSVVALIHAICVISLFIMAFLFL